MSNSSKAIRLVAHHKRLLSLCDELEAVADKLPNNVDQPKCLALASTMQSLFEEVHALEEGEIFPTLLTLAPLRLELGAVLEQLRSDHRTDLCYAQEVQEMLEEYAAGRRNVSPDAAGFMLRGLFQGMRRHIALEEYIMVPLLDLAQKRARRAPVV